MRRDQTADMLLLWGPSHLHGMVGFSPMLFGSNRTSNYHALRIICQMHACQIEVMFEVGSLKDVEQGTKLLAILDEDWPEFLREERCMVRNRLNRWIVPLDEGPSSDEYDGYYKTTIRQVRVPGYCCI